MLLSVAVVPQETSHFVMEHILKLIFRPIKTFYKPILILLLVFFSFESEAQDLQSFNESRIKRVKTGMYILGSWALINMASSPIGVLNSKGSQKYFHQMNGYWNIVNFGLAAGGLYSISKVDPSSLQIAESIAELNSMQKILLFNAGLDLAYMAGGAYLIERSKNVENRSEMLRGFGRSIILQGAFLFVFDLTFYTYLNSLNAEIPVLLSGISLSPNGLCYSMRF